MRSNELKRTEVDWGIYRGIFGFIGVQETRVHNCTPQESDEDDYGQVYMQHRRAIESHRPVFQAAE